MSFKRPHNDCRIVVPSAFLRRWEWAAKLVGGLASYVLWIPVKKGGQIDMEDLSGEIPSFKMLGNWQVISISFESYMLSLRSSFT